MRDFDFVKSGHPRSISFIMQVSIDLTATCSTIVSLAWTRSIVQVDSDIKPLIDQITVPILVIDVEAGGRFRHVCINLAAEHYYAISNDEYAGSYLDALKTEDKVSKRQRRRAIAAYKRCVERGETVEFEFRYLMPDGEETWARHSCVPTFNANREVVQIMVTTYDITDLVKSRKHMEDLLTKTLSGFVKICAGCKDINREGEWISIEKYADEELDYHQFSHGICGKCRVALYDNEDGSL